MSMHISSILPAVNNPNIFQAKRASFNCQTSMIVKPSKATTHLANLEKILDKQTSEALKPIENGLSQNRGKTMLERLDMTNILPEMKAAEDLSPMHSNHLNRLLSTTVQYSPRNNFGDRWPEYHGSNDWAGLLDPLDENLRRELVRHGEFVQAAYHAFHSKPARSAKDDNSAEPVALPDKSYRVTKNLYATSSTQLPRWIDELAPSLGWMTQRSSLIGYVAVCDDKREIQRIGRRDIVIALRGTSTCLEWIENFRAHLIPIQSELDGNTKPKVECGFWSLYRTHGEYVASLAELVVDEVRRLIKLYKGEALSISVTGHSLGAALALLVANEISTCTKDVPPIAVFSFGGPQVGNKDFGDQIVAKNVKVLRIVNNQDLITRVPGEFLDVGKLEKFTRIGSLLKNVPLAYSHVGTEFRVDSKNSPYLKPNADIACCHDLEAYLHLVDGFSSSSSPFRPNAKRSLVRLLNDQRSNVKQLYTSKAKNLRLKC